MAGHTDSSVAAAIVDILLAAHHQDLPIYEILLSVISDPAIASFINPLPNYTRMLRMAQNLTFALRDIAARGRQTGLYHLVLGSVAGPNLEPDDLVDVLDVDIRTARKTFQLLLETPMSEKSSKRVPLFKKPIIKRQRVLGITLDHMLSFMDKHTYASSDIKRVKTITDANGRCFEAQIRYRTDSLLELYDMYKEEYPHDTISSTFFITHIPKNILARRHYSGLCKFHHSAHSWQRNANQLRPAWHRPNCNCVVCVYCQPNGCDHGKKCLRDYGYSCSRCLGVMCPLKETKDIGCNYTITKYVKTKSGGMYCNHPVEFHHRSSRFEMLSKFYDQAIVFNVHFEHVKLHKIAIAELLDNLPRHILVSRWDFLQNVVLIRGSEVASSYFSRKQIALLIATTWHRDRNDQIVKQFYEFFSDFLGHSSLFFKKCVKIFMEYFDFPMAINTIYIQTDGAVQHFQKRHNLLWGRRFYRKFRFHLRWCVDPPYHGKGDCDSRGAVIKRAVRKYVLRPGHNIDSTKQLVDFTNNFLHTKTPGRAFLLKIVATDVERLATLCNGIKSHFDYIFDQPNPRFRWRKFPCHCHCCRVGLYKDCIRSDRSGPLIVKNVTQTGTRGPKATTLQATDIQLQRITHVGSNPPRRQNFVVQKILNKRTSEYIVEYNVSWVGYPTKFDSWLPEGHVNLTLQLLAEFDRIYFPSDDESSTSSDTSSTSSSDSQGYEIEAILNRRIEDGNVEYLVKWLDWAEQFNSWVTEADLAGSMEMLNNFNNQ